MNNATYENMKGEGAMAISKLGQRGQVVIGKDIRKELGLKSGDFLEVILSPDHKIIITPKKLVDLEDTLTEEEEKLVAEGFEEYKKGNFIPWNQLKNELGL